MSIQLLDWDTQFFNKKIGKLNLNTQEASTLSNLNSNQWNEFDIVYIFSPIQLDIKAPLMDVKITYTKNANQPNPISDIVPFNTYIHNYNQLLELAYVSGHDSRFLKDPAFGLLQFQRLYKQWIDNSLNNHNTQVLIHTLNNNITGFVTLQTTTQAAQIGLIAVSPSHQGLGIGKKLMQAAEHFATANYPLTVATQETNIGACKFYESLNFTITKTEYIYHFKHDTV